MSRPSQASSRAPTGPSQRQLRVGELIRRTLSEILAKGDLHDPELARTPITVGEVRASPDLKQATAYVYPLGGVGGPAILEALQRNKATIRHHVARAMTLKHVPDLRFRLDDTYDRLDDARRLFSDEQVLRDIAAPATDPETPAEPKDESGRDGAA